jgi:hypothetical protein
MAVSTSSFGFTLVKVHSIRFPLVLTMVKNARHKLQKNARHKLQKNARHKLQKNETKRKKFISSSWGYF